MTTFTFSLTDLDPVEQTFVVNTGVLGLKFPCPWFEEFSALFVPCHSNTITTADIYILYQQFVKLRTKFTGEPSDVDAPDEVKLATFRRFNRRLGAEHQSLGIEKHINKPIGYRVKLPKYLNQTQIISTTRP